MTFASDLNADVVNSIVIGEIDWNDLRYFLAVSRMGSFSGAANTLNTHQSTVSRRIQILEDRLRSRLFSRTAQGVVPTPEGQALICQAERVEAIMFDLKRQIAGGNNKLNGRVRIGTTDGFGPYWITPRLPALSQAHPGLLLDLCCSEFDPSLERLEADIILRLGDEVQEPNSDNETLGHMPFRLYASRDYLNRVGTPTTWDEIVSHHKIIIHDYYPNLGPWKPWADLAQHPQQVAYRTNSSAALVEATKAGIGISLMSGYIHAHLPTLIPLTDPPGWQRPSLPVVLVYHHDMRRTKRVEVVIRFLRDAFRAWVQNDLPIIR
jgi:DNA-binding transcriptional LysR family regulator